MDYENLLYEVRDYVAIVVINRPKSLNSLNVQTLRELKDVVKKVNLDSNVRALVITGAGDKAFIAGADVPSMSKFSTEEIYAFSERGHNLLNLMELLPKPVLAAVNGYALGGGMELTLACDMVFASTNAVFGLPEVKLGIIPGFGGTQRLPRLIGAHLAKELIFTGERISATRAREIGLVNHVYEPTELLERVVKFASKLQNVSSIAVGTAKKAVQDGFQVPLEEGNQLELNAFTHLFGTEDQKEGMQAFIEKRKPNFRGKNTGHMLIN